MDVRFVNGIVVLPLLGLASLVILAIALRGLMERRPFLVSSRWLSASFVFALAPSVLRPLLPFWMSGIGDATVASLVNWLPAVIFVVVIAFACAWNRGYLAIGVTDASLRSAVLASLKRLGLPYDEARSSIRLPSLGVDLEVSSVQCGWARISFRQAGFANTLRQIASEANEHFRETLLPADERFLVQIVAAWSFTVWVVLALLISVCAATMLAQRGLLACGV